MELIQKYVYQVYKEKSFSAAARTLYISQPALSAAIARLEKEMGMKIFDRTKQPISLTPQGIIYIEALEEIMSIENTMEKRFRALSDMSYGSLTIGGSSFASYTLMSAICAAFYQKYPGIKVTLDIGNLGTRDFLSDSLQKGEIDLVMTYVNNNDRYIYEPLIEERLIIAMHKDAPWASKLTDYAMTHEELISGNYNRQKELEDFTLFQDVEFLSYESNSYTERLMTQMLGYYKTVPYTIKNARHSEMHYNLMCAGIGAVIIPSLPIIHSQHIDKDILYFVPKDAAFCRSIYVARTHMTDDSPIVRNFILTAKEVCANMKVL